ncbi:3-methyladenine DNA glycosylase [Streptomyces agglomeratus]|uniref:DNA-3-methyladenine glycosylase family protein n=1 Tax=Streptomyces agglomeratus TaxID=285458 RepID=UPI0008542DCF|nr:DNA-3-methyladenine glycosylase [Streptomyces agglomeratus]OEJ22951.1 3-methyladenine DNA glycosylase [Streptomyces agglomeratus]
MPERSWVPPGPYHLRHTLRVLQRGGRDPAFRWDAGTLWRASRTPQGPATLRITTETGAVRGEAWGPGADWALETLPALLGAKDEPEAFTPRHRIVAQAVHRNPGLRLTQTGLVMEALVASVLEQKISTREAFAAWRQLLLRYGESPPGPAPEGMRIPPTPSQWAMIPSWEWHRAGVDDKRASAILRACRYAPRLEEAAGMELAEALRRLQLVPGIGPWTAAEVLQRSNGAPDALTLGDLHLPGHIGYALTGRRGLGDADMLELLVPYAGQRHRAARLILLAGRIPTRREPRAPIGRIARL